jgi:hypothetical protein
MNRWGFDEVNGIVIGGDDYKKYGFYRNNKQILNTRYFDNDSEAIEWLKTEHPDEFKKGVEMRVYN